MIHLRALLCAFEGKILDSDKFDFIGFQLKSGLIHYEDWRCARRKIHAIDPKKI